jgi:hypothetical protein
MLLLRMKAIPRAQAMHRRARARAHARLGDVLVMQERDADGLAVVAPSTLGRHTEYDSATQRGHDDSSNDVFATSDLSVPNR